MSFAIRKGPKPRSQVSQTLSRQRVVKGVGEQGNIAGPEAAEKYGVALGTLLRCAIERGRPVERAARCWKRQVELRRKDGGGLRRVIRLASSSVEAIDKGMMK